MKKALLVITFLGLLLTSHPTLAETSDEVKYNDLTKKIQELEAKIATLKTQEKTLTSQLDYLDSQMTLTQAKIGQAQENIIRKEKELMLIGQDIESLKTRINRLSEAVDRQKEAFEERLAAQYKRTSTTPVFELFLGSHSFSDVVTEIKYLKVAEIHDQELITQMVNTKQSYKDQTDLLEEKKAEAETVKAQLETEKARLTTLQDDLVEQSKEKEALLKDTQNDEAKYQDLLAKAKAEFAAIASAFSGADFTTAKDVKAGDVITVMGNSGYPSCSTGAHLHFEVHKNGSLANAEDYLENQTLVNYNDGNPTISIGSGDWPWPMKSPIITQRFGKTPYSYRYPGGLHTGIDIVSQESYLIYAPADGKMIKKSGTCGSSTYNYVLIRHADGVDSLYLHVQ